MKTSRLFVLGVFCLGLTAFAGGASVATAQSLFAPRPFGGQIRFRFEPDLGPPVANDVKKGILEKPKFVKPAPTPTTFTFNVKQPLDQGWRLASTRVASELPKAIDQAGLNFHGFRPYGIKLNPTQSPTLRVLVVKEQVQFEYAARGNRLEATFTTPDLNVGPLQLGAPKRFDPRVVLTFDLVFRVTVTPQLHGAPKVSKARVEVQNARLLPGNDTAKIAKAANDLVAWFGGPNFVRKIESTINSQGVSVSDPLAKAMAGLNQRIAPLTKNVRTLTVTHAGDEVFVYYSNKANDGPIVR